MRPSTVRVPSEMEALFVEAERVVGAYFREKIEQPEHGTIEIAAERYVLVRAAALSVELFGVVRRVFGPEREADADGFARHILFDLAHAVGRSDARLFGRRIDASDPLAALSLGPVHFAYAGWARVDISPQSNVAGDESCFLLYDHPYSFEADAWIGHGERAAFPVCIMNAGYSSGWCSEAFGVDLVAAEILCRARGDAACRFVMAPPHRVEARIAEHAGARETSGASGAGSVAGTPPGGHAPEIPDLFARKRLEDRLRQAHAELEHRVRERTAELERANALLRVEIEQREQVERQLRQSQKMEAIGRLAGGIAHDFNNVLGVILGYATVLERRSEGDPLLREAHTEIERAVTRASELTRQLLAVSRGRIQKSESIDPSAAVREMSSMLKRMVGDHIRIEERLAADAPTIVANASAIQQVLLNLVVNARDAMPDGGVLTLATERVRAPADERTGMPASECCAIVVRDTGVGMDEATRDRIFDPFFTTKPAGEGSGLGLSTVYGIVTQLGGSISVESEPGRGATFRVLFEAAPPEGTGSGARRSSRPPPRARPDGAGAPISVLLVEDDAALRRVVVQMLELEGYRVIAAEDGERALAALEEGFAPDVLVTDVMMPGTSGAVLAQRARERTGGELPVVFVSGYAEVEELRRGVADARTECLAKPVTREALRRAIGRVLAAG